MSANAPDSRWELIDALAETHRAFVFALQRAKHRRTDPCRRPSPTPRCATPHARRHASRVAMSQRASIHGRRSATRPASDRIPTSAEIATASPPC